MTLQQISDELRLSEVAPDAFAHSLYKV